MTMRETADSRDTGGPPPLAGVRVAVTRPRRQAAPFVQALEARGAVPAVFPMIRIAPPTESSPLRSAAGRTEEYDWLVFTSVNGVRHFASALEAAGRGPAALEHPRIACIGPATAGAALEAGLRATVVPSEYVAEAVVEAIAEAAGGEERLAGTRVLLPRAAGARAVLRERLTELGAEVDEIEAYRAIRDAGGADELRRRLDTGTTDVVTFTASSTVDHFVAAVGDDVGSARVACIGPITARTARGYGLPVDVVAADYTIPGLVRALCDCYDQGEWVCVAGVT